MASENICPLKGVIYSMETKTWPNKNPDLPEHEFYYFQLEFEVSVQGRTTKSIAEFQLMMGMSYEGYEVGDPVEIDFFPFGKELEKKDKTGTWWKRENRVVFMKHSDIQTKEKFDNKRPVKAMSNIDTIADPPKKDETFVGVTPQRPSEPVDDDIDDDLPF